MNKLVISNYLKLVQSIVKEKTHGSINKNLSFHFEQARLENQSYEEFLLNLFQYEVELRQQNGVNARIRAAKFPYLKHLEELEVEAFPSEAKKHYQTLRSLEFIEKKQNVILAGNPGTGKSHTIIGLGIKACQAGYHVYFAHVPTLIIELKEAKNDRVL